MKPTTKRRCTHLTKSGQYCRAWAMRDSDPPTCAIHAGRVIGQGAPEGNRNAVTHSFYAALERMDLDQEIEPPSIDTIIHDLMARQTQLSIIIDDRLDHLTIPELVSLFALHGQNTGRLGSLLRHRLLHGRATPAERTQVCGPSRRTIPGFRTASYGESNWMLDTNTAGPASPGHPEPVEG